MFPVQNHNNNIDTNHSSSTANKSPTINNINNINGINLADVTHKLHVTTYFSPTYCNYCSQFLMGLMKQGLKCESMYILKIKRISYYLLYKGTNRVSTSHFLYITKKT